MYASLHLAEEALIAARTRFHFSAGNGPIAVYLCDDCGQFHLTSKGKMNDRLAEQMKNGSIDLQKEANWWMDKFKKS